MSLMLHLGFALAPKLYEGLFFEKGGMSECLIHQSFAELFEQEMEAYDISCLDTAQLSSIIRNLLEPGMREEGVLHKLEAALDSSFLKACLEEAVKAYSAEVQWDVIW